MAFTKNKFRNILHTTQSTVFSNYHHSTDNRSTTTMCHLTVVFFKATDTRHRFTAHFNQICKWAKAAHFQKYFYLAKFSFS